MTEVRVLCRDCDSVLKVPAEGVEILLCTDNPSLTVLIYRCPVCGPQRRPVTEAEISLLRGAVAILHWTEEKPAPPINLDDLIDFHEHVDEEINAILGED